MNRCTDPGLGAMLHAWELGMLSEDDRQRFEVHLLQCQACADEASQFTQAGKLLRQDPDLRPLSGELSRSSVRIGAGSKETRYRLVRSFLIAAVLLIVAIPVYKWTIAPRERSPHVQQLKLVPLRSQGSNVVRHNLGGTVEVHFFIEGAAPDQPYRVSVKSQMGKSAYKNDGFDDFSVSGAGLLVLDVVDLDTGLYTLTVTPSLDSLNVIQEYNFRVE
jgi:hypothetical protein